MTENLNTKYLRQIQNFRNSELLVTKRNYNFPIKKNNKKTR